MLRFNMHVWMLWLLFSGTLSDDSLDGCEQQPCQNGGVCESHDGVFRCLCSQQTLDGRLYGGESCTIALSGCDDNQCENGGICSPLLVNSQHTYTCICLAGFTGPRCQTPTVFSFESGGYMYIETQLLDAGAPLNVTFSFRTERPIGTLLQRTVGDLLLSVELMGGHLCLMSLRDSGSSTLVQELPEHLSDNRWHTVEASLGGVVSLIRLLCTEGSCARDASARDASAEVQLLEAASALPEPGAVQQSLFIGADYRRGGPAAFLGCFRDVFVYSHLVVPVNLPQGSDAHGNVTVGCSDRSKCDDSPCQNRGRCLTQGWRSYTCECHRPYEGTDCAEEYVTARFGGDDLEGHAVFSVDDDPGSTVTISMFLRTRQPSGLLLVLANSTSQYLRLWLEQGRVKVQVNNFETLTGRGVVNDGHFHLVTVKLDGTEAFLSQSAQSQGSLFIRSIQVHRGDLVFVGGLPDAGGCAAFGGYFKGCVQDLRVNGQRLQFFPIAAPVDSYELERLVSVERGCSSDNACAANPCLNGGVCYSMWDHFVCNCPPNTAGQRCEEMKWCELSPCPPTSVCQPRSHGFECLSNVTFRAESLVLHYRSKGKIERSLASVSVRLRTRQPAATVLRAQAGSASFTLSLQDSRAVMELRAGGDEATLRSSGIVSDGEWHRVDLVVESQISRWTMAVDGGKEVMSDAIAGNLDFLREGGDVFLGGPSLSGCLGPVEIGGLLLPFHSDTELKLPRPQEEQFSRMSGDVVPHYGCWGSNVCEPNPCQNGGVCDDLFDLHRCKCPPDWAGPRCQDLADTCASSPCVYGHCISLPEGHVCVCEEGYAGDQCEAEVDFCENSNCSDGATCLKGFQSYGCLCPQNLTGQYCEERVPDIPWYIETSPLPKLPVSTCMGTRWNYSCFNGGNCSDVDNTCYCLPGFTGQWCERDVDECASDPCMNGGFCINYVNSFECVCDINYSGVHCQIDVSDFYLYLFLGLWQNLFQLVSYLVMRLDDEPEIEWGFHIND